LKMGEIRTNAREVCVEKSSEVIVSSRFVEDERGASKMAAKFLTATDQHKKNIIVLPRTKVYQEQGNLKIEPEGEFTDIYTYLVRTFLNTILTSVHRRCS